MILITDSKYGVSGNEYCLIQQTYIVKAWLTEFEKTTEKSSQTMAV